MTPPSQIDEAKTQAIYDELEGMHVQLDSNPIIYGPKRLQEKVARSRNFLTRLERIYLDAFRTLKWSEDTLRREKLHFELEEKRLLAEDPVVRAERNIRDREARCHMILRDHLERINELEIQVGGLTALIAILRTKRTDLKDVGTKIRDQVKLVHEEIMLGSGWGSHPAPGSTPILLRGGQAGTIVAQDTESVVDDILGKIDGEMHLGVAADWEDLSESEQEAGLAELETALEAVPTEAEDEAEDEVEDEDEVEEEEEDEVDRLLQESMTAGEAEEALDDILAGFDIEDPPQESVIPEPEAPKLESFPKLGFCSVCGSPSYDTPSGPTCGEHGGADVVDVWPVPVSEMGEMDDLGDLFSNVEDVETANPSETPATTLEPEDSVTAEEAEILLDQLPAAQPVGQGSAKGPAPVVITADIEDLIDMFS